LGVNHVEAPQLHDDGEVHEAEHAKIVEDLEKVRVRSVEREGRYTSNDRCRAEQEESLGLELASVLDHDDAEENVCEVGVRVGGRCDPRAEVVLAPVHVGARPVCNV